MAYDPYGFAATEQRHLSFQREQRRELEQRVCPPVVVSAEDKRDEANEQSPEDKKCSTCE